VSVFILAEGSHWLKEFLIVIEARFVGMALSSSSEEDI